MAPTLTYFDFPGRGEVARLLFSIKGVEFEDKRVTFGEWLGNPDIKAATPFGQMPVLEVDGKKLAQSAAIDRYVAHLTGILPEDPWKAALADQAWFFAEDLWQLVNPTLYLQEPHNIPSMDDPEGTKAREELVKGALGDKLKLLSKLLESRPGKYLTGDELTHGDVVVFVRLGNFQSGWLSGLPTDLLDSYPVLRDFHNSIASLPEVAAFYSKEDDDVRKTGFRPRS